MAAVDWGTPEQMRERIRECGGDLEEIGRRYFDREGTSVRRACQRMGLWDEVLAARASSRHQAPAVGRGKEMPRLDDEVSEAEVLRQEVDELRKELRKARKTDVASERIVLSIEHTLSNWTPKTHRPTKAPPPKRNPKAHHRQMLVLSDFHGGEVVDPGVVNGLNAYSWEIMEDRVEETIRAVLSHKAKSPDLTGLDIIFLGDMCSGSNHDELAITNEMPLAEQSIKMGEVMGNIVKDLAPHYETVKCVSVEGNHPRFSRRPAAKNPHDNGDWIAGRFAKVMTSDLPNVESFTVGRGSVIHQFAGRNFYIWHSDGVKSAMPGVPWGGLIRRINTIQAGYTIPLHHFLCGHWHTANIIAAGRLIVNGSLKGLDEWVLKSFGGGDAPTQWLLTFDETKQRMTEARLVTPTAGIPVGAGSVISNSDD